jgi:alkanesulfonate monooxygenase SsuD/methylene tetrahydromethanopterin reductase-like flavin-dependent oxidoreductase (luciferase family)
MDEMIEILQGLMSGEYYSFESEYYQIPRIKLCPVPSRPPRLIIGGHSKPAYRRAARLADGFNFTGLTRDELVERIGLLDGFRAEYGRENEPFSIYAGLPVRGPDEMRELEELGVTDLAVGYRNPYQPDTMTLQQKIDWVRRFGDEVIAKF